MSESVALSCQRHAKNHKPLIPTVGCEPRDANTLLHPAAGARFSARVCTSTYLLGQFGARWGEGPIQATNRVEWGPGLGVYSASAAVVAKVVGGIRTLLSATRPFRVSRVRSVTLSA